MPGVRKRKTSTSNRRTRIFLSCLRGRYKEGDRRRLEVVLTYGALTDETAEDETAKVDTTTAQEINNVYVSIKDDTDAIIGFPYEYRIPTLKDGEEKTLDFELRRNVDSLVVSLQYP